jgi:nucleotide-binding universal stress UspA family protein
MSQFPPKSILCPLDLSTASPEVLRWASLLAASYNARLQILHAEWVEYPRYFLPSQAGELAAAAERNRSAIGEDLKKLINETISAETPYEVTILEGHPVERILEYVEQHKPDLIVMGSHGRSGFARMRLGSVAENVVQQTSIPTLVVRAPGGKPAPRKISSVLCPVTFDEHADQGIMISAALASTTGAHLIVMHVEEGGPASDGIARQLCDLVPNDVKGHCEVIEVIRHGNAAEQILLVAREHGADIITLTAKHRRFLDVTVIGNTTEQVMRHADSAVLVLPVAGEQHE